MCRSSAYRFVGQHGILAYFLRGRDGLSEQAVGQLAGVRDQACDGVCHQGCELFPIEFGMTFIMIEGFYYHLVTLAYLLSSRTKHGRTW